MSPKNMTVYSRFCAGRGLACKRCKRAPPRRVRLGIFAELFRCSQRALAVNHGSDQTVSKAIAGRHQFADILVVEFRTAQGNFASIRVWLTTFLTTMPA